MGTRAWKLDSKAIFFLLSFVNFLSNDLSSHQHQPLPLPIAVARCCCPLLLPIAVSANFYTQGWKYGDRSVGIGAWEWEHGDVSMEHGDGRLEIEQ